MFYNTDVAAKAGVLAANGQLQDVSSPQEFLGMAREMQKVTKAHGLSFGYLGSGSQMWRLFYTLYKQHGVDMELTPGQPMKADRDAAVESLEFMASLFDDTVAAKSGDISTGIAEFARGSSGMLFSGVWELPTLKKAGLPVDAATIPTLYGTPAAYADSHSFVLPRQLNDDDEKRRSVYKFVSDVLKGSLSWAEAGHIPAYQPIVKSQAYRELTPQIHYANAADIITYDPESWFSGSGSDWQTYFAENVQNVLLGRDKAADGWDAFVRPHQHPSLPAQPGLSHPSDKGVPDEFLSNIPPRRWAYGDLESRRAPSDNVRSGPVQSAPNQGQPDRLGLRRPVPGVLPGLPRLAHSVRAVHEPDRQVPHRCQRQPDRFGQLR